MSKVLLVTSSPRGKASHSSSIGRTLADQLASGDPNSTVVVRDLAREPLPPRDPNATVVGRGLAREPLPHLGEDFVTALGTPQENRTPAQSAAVALSDHLVAELF